jgi:hypothetical protein
MKTRTRILATAAAAAALFSASASATLLNVATRLGNFTTPSAAAAFVPLNDAGATTVFINVPAGRYQISYSAECSVNAPAGNFVAWVDIDILVDGVAIRPTAGTADAFCSADGQAGFAGYSRNTIVTYFSVGAGVHAIRVVVRGNAGATGSWLGDTALIISN